MDRSGHLQFLERGPVQTGAPELTSSLPAGWLCSGEVQDRMKKIALIAFLLAACLAAGRAQESRQDVSISGTVLVEPFIASPTDTDVSANRAFGALASYRFMLTPSSAVEANYGITYQNTLHYVISNTNDYLVSTRTQEVSFAYVRSFNFHKFNPFAEAGAGGFIFLPIRNTGTKTLNVQQQTEIGALFGAGVAYEISPSFDIRAEYRGLVMKVPTFKDTLDNFTTNKWYQIYNPVIGVAYHF
jgi:outer membrane immunogenic protein